MKKEPAIIVSLIVWLLIRGLSLLDVDTTLLSPEMLEGAAEFVIAIGGALVIRAKVVSENTIRQAGLTPREVEVRAADPSVMPKLP